MRATMNPAVAQRIIRAGIWPKLDHDDCQPKLLPGGEVITFYDVDHRTGLKLVVGKMHANGFYKGAKRNLGTLVDLAAQIGEDLQLVVAPTPTPAVKKVREPSEPAAIVPGNPAKSAKPTQKPSAPKPALSLRDVMAKRKAAK